jgi:hypothetical protein
LVPQPGRHGGTHDGQGKDLRGVLGAQLHKLPMAPGPGLGKKRSGGRRCPQDLRMAGRTTLASRLPSLGGSPASLALWRRRIGRWWPAGVGGVLGPSRCKSCQAFQAGKPHKTHTHRGLVPSFRGYPQALGKGGGIKPIAHEAVSSGLVRPSLSPNIWDVSRKVPGEGSATCCGPVITYCQAAIEGPGPAAFAGMQQGQRDDFTRRECGLRVLRHVQPLLVHGVEQCDNEIVRSHKTLLAGEVLQPLQLERLYGYLSSCAFYYDS